MNKIRLFLLITLCVSVLGGYGLRKEKKVDESLFLNEVAPNVEFTGKGGIPPHYSSKEGIVAFNTYDVAPSIRGYAGPIKVLLALNREGRITGIRILEHKETPNYVHQMLKPEYLRQFLGKSINDPFEIDKDIDGISRATVSVKALAETVRKSSREIASRVMGIEVRGEEARETHNLKWILYLVFFGFSFGAYLITKKSERYLRVRDAVLVISILLVGLWLSSPFSILHVFNIVLMRFSTDMLWFVIVASTLLSVIVAGRFYCGWLCPFGAVSEFIGRMPFKKWDIPAHVDDKWRNLKYILLGLITVVVVISGRVGFGNYETYVTLFSFHGNVFTWVLVVIGILANLRVERFWCRYLCPVAALTGVFSRKDQGYVSRYDCPMGNKPVPLISECIRCNRCYRKS
jgi:Na+-translocating ferredoxin:NAD+ oxidoreductase RnfG subunit